jgi:hypothetical protein
MATGDQNDMVARLKAVLPGGWFPDTDVVLNLLLQGSAATLAPLYALIQYVSNQTRVQTSVGIWVDMWVADFFATRLPRRQNETDAAYGTRGGKEIFRERNTRQAIISVLTDLTGRVPHVFEPMRTGDTGGWNVARGYNSAGAYGSLMKPFIIYVQAYRPAAPGFPNAGGGYGISAGYDRSGSYVTKALAQASVTDADIYAAVASVTPAGVTAAVLITDGPMDSLGNFVLGESAL